MDEAALIRRGLVPAPVARRLRRGARVAVVGCGRGGLVISLATAFPRTVVAGFDRCPEHIEVARRAAAISGVADRVTLEVSPVPGPAGQGYDVVVLTGRTR